MALRTIVAQRSLQSAALYHPSRRVGRALLTVSAVNRADLVAELATKTGMKKKDAEQSVSALLDIIVEKVAAGEKVTVVGFGTFEPKERNARQGRNPQTGKPISIPAKTVPTFSAGKAFKVAVDAKNQAGAGAPAAPKAAAKS